MSIEIFLHCAKVVSAPYVFFLTGDFSNFYAGSLWKDYLKMLDYVARQCLVGIKRIFNQPREEDIVFLL